MCVVISIVLSRIFSECDIPRQVGRGKHFIGDSEKKCWLCRNSKIEEWSFNGRDREITTVSCIHKITILIILIVILLTYCLVQYCVTRRLTADQFYLKVNYLLP